jgi:hypothetical protein
MDAIWLAGGGVRAGTSMAPPTTSAISPWRPQHIHDFHATVLHLMGLDHTLYNYSGQIFDATDVAGVVATKIIA